MKKGLFLMGCLASAMFLSQVGISTSSPTETLDVNGIERVRELPKHNTANAIFTKPDGTKSETKNQTFKATRMVVADANGVLGYADWNPDTTPEIPKKRVIIGYWAGLWDTNLYALGGTGFPAFNSQLKSMVNYGPIGIYNKVGGIDFQQFQTEELDNFTGAQLKMLVDVFCIGVKYNEDLSPANVAKIKDFVDLGGVAIVLLENSRNTPALHGFGGTGTVGGASSYYSYPIPGTTGTTGVFGSISNNITITGAQTGALVSNVQLPPGAQLLARHESSTSDKVGIWITGTGGRAIFFWDEGVFRNSSVSGVIIDTDQEKYLHNLIAYALDKLNL